MTDNKDVLKFTLKSVNEMPLDKNKKRHRKTKIDYKEKTYLEKIGRKPKQTKMTANYIQEIYNRDKKEC